MKSRLRSGIAALAIALAFISTNLGAGCQRHKTAVNPTGTWNISISGANTQPLPTGQTLKLTLNGGALTGTLTYRSSPVVNGKSQFGELPITEAKLQGSEISFNFSHPPAFASGPGAGSGSGPTYSYQGTIKDDTINGTMTEEWMGESRQKSWEAARLKE